MAVLFRLSLGVPSQFKDPIEHYPLRDNIFQCPVPLMSFIIIKILSQCVSMSQKYVIRYVIITTVFIIGNNELLTGSGV